jgi:hypothetical protein
MGRWELLEGVRRGEREDAGDGEGEDPFEKQSPGPGQIVVGGASLADGPDLRCQPFKRSDFRWSRRRKDLLEVRRV